MSRGVSAGICPPLIPSLSLHRRPPVSHRSLAPTASDRQTDSSPALSPGDQTNHGRFSAFSPTQWKCVVPPSPRLHAHPRRPSLSAPRKFLPSVCVQPSPASPRPHLLLRPLRPGLSPDCAAPCSAAPAPVGGRAGRGVVLLGEVSLLPLSLPAPPPRADTAPPPGQQPVPGAEWTPKT